MKTKWGGALLIAMTAALLQPAQVPVRAAGDENVRTIELIADKNDRFKFPDGKKGPLVLQAGERVKFKVTAKFGGERATDGAVHSFVVGKLVSQGWNVRLMEGVQEFTLTAPPPGDYLIECTVKCGPGHDEMNLKMVVK